jgi:hypothetical protein
MANNTRTIYEFSTSIGIKILSDGRWMSTGFQSGWKNNTFDSSQASTIPEPVRQAIANKEFKLAESDRSPFAVIGRFVKRQGCKTWAVVAFVILGIDNEGRDVPVYRYFCCEAENDESALESIEQILYRALSYLQDNGGLPFFNPHQFIELAKCNPVDEKGIESSITLSEEQKLLIRTDIERKNLVLPKGFIENSMAAGNAYTLIKLNRFAWERALATRQVEISQGTLIDNFAWAYNVESLERQNGFVVIQTAYGSLRQIRGSSSDIFVSGVNEQGLKAAIKAITEPQQFKVEKVIELSTILQDKKLRDVQFLSRIFEDLAGRGVLPNTSHPTTIKLFVLRVFLTSSATFNTFLKWFNQQDPQGKLVNIYKKFEQDFFNTIDAYPSDCATLKEMVSEEVCQAVLESLLVKRDISPESLYVLMQNSRWIKKQNLLESIRTGITEVDSAIAAKTAFSGADIWKPLERFIEKVQRSKVSSGTSTQRVKANSELPKWLRTILPEFISSHLGDRWHDINASQKKRAEAREQENRLVKAEDYYIPLAELLRMLSPNTDEHLYFDCISNAQQKLPLAYSAIGDADNTGKKRFNLTIGKPTSIDNIENKLVGQQISFFLIAFISVIIVPLLYLIVSIILWGGGGLWKLIGYIINGVIYRLKQFWEWIIGITPDDALKNSIRQKITTLLDVNYANTTDSKKIVLDCIEGIGRLFFIKKNESEQICLEFTKSILEELESKLKRNSSSQVLVERLKFFRVYFLSTDHDEINRYLEWLKELKGYDRDRVLNFQNEFKKILDDIKTDNKDNQDTKDYVEPFVTDVINFILSRVIDDKENSTSYKNIIDWIVHHRSFVFSRNLVGYVIKDLGQFTRTESNESDMSFWCSSNFWDKLKENWDNFRKTDERKTAPEYQNLVKFFDALSQELSKTPYEQECNLALGLSAYFSQISNGYVSEDVLQKVGQEEVYGLKLTLKQSDDDNPPANTQRSSTKRNQSNSNKDKDYIGLMVLAIIFLLSLLVLVVVNHLNNAPKYLSNQPQTATYSNTGGDNISPSPYPSFESNQTKSKLTCKASINGEDIDLEISNISTSTKEIYSSMYAVKEQKKQDLIQYKSLTQPTNNKSESTIKNMDGEGAFLPKTKYYIVASTQKLNEYKKTDDLKKDIGRFKPNQAVEDPCYVTITTQ